MDWSLLVKTFVKMRRVVSLCENTLGLSWLQYGKEETDSYVKGTEKKN